MFSRLAQQQIYIIGAALCLGAVLIPSAKAGPTASDAATVVTIREKWETFWYSLPFVLPRPYLREVTPLPIVVERMGGRIPPLLPRIVQNAPAQALAPQAATFAPAPPAAGAPAEPARAEPDEAVGADSSKSTTLDEVIGIFRSAGGKRGSDKSLGVYFDSTFQAPAPAPQPSSSATYRRE